MAEKRMLSRKITENDNFVKLPATAQALYMHLTLGADDDGFCDQVSTALFRAHAKQKDLDALLNARYLLRFENGVMVIKHWRMANAGRADRYTPTAYQEEYQRLTIKPNKAYTLATTVQPEAIPDDSHTGNQMATKRQPDDNRMTPQKRKEENRREENNIYTNAHTRTRERDDGFERFWAAYPRKSGDIRQAFMEYRDVINSGVDPETLIQAITAQTEGVTAEDLHFLPGAEKWLRNRGWESKASLKSPPKETKAKPKQYVTAAEYKPKQTMSVEDITAIVDAI